MLRLVLIQVSLFAAPFLLWVLWALVRRRGLATWRSEAPTAGLAIAGLALVIASLVWLAVFEGGSSQGTYEPDRFENGRLVPGRIR
ncbi:MAG: DUF6111 family protein [Siculibacillus sp.]